VSVNNVLRKIFGSKWDDGSDEWKILHSEELNESPSPTDRIAKSGWFQQAEHLAWVSEVKKKGINFSGDFLESIQLEKQGDRRII
jgi:hypothetical protein